MYAIRSYYELIGDITYPINHGSVCSKGVSELVSMQTPTRLLRPHMREDIETPYTIVGWDEALDTISEAIRQTPKDKT